MKQAIKAILSISDKTYYNWKKEKRPIISFLEKYFTEEDLEEFLNTGKLEKLEYTQEITKDIYIHENIMIDNAIYTAKDKLKRFWGEKWQEVRVGIKKNMKNIIAEIKLNNENYTLENSKGILIHYTMGDDANKSILYNKSAKKLISDFIDESLSEIEAYAIIQHSDKIFTK